MRKRGRTRRGLRRRYGRMLPVIPLAMAKLLSFAKVERALEPLGRLVVGGWAVVTGSKKRKGKRS